jgi:FkbM family methyltransferase
METTRRLIRNVLGYDSRIYRSGATLLNMASVVRKEGISTWRALKSDRPSSVRFRNLQYPILVRPETMDADIIISNIVREEYGQFEPSSEPLWMIDAGAYIGDTASFFLSRFPKLRVVALEPSPPSYEAATSNLRPYMERVTLLRKGLWGSNKTLNLRGTWAGATIEEIGEQIECVTIPSIIEEFDIPRVNILKMDVEGAETDVFSASDLNWLKKVDLLLVEIHNEEAMTVVSSALKRAGFSMKQFRSVWYCSPC